MNNYDEIKKQPRNEQRDSNEIERVCTEQVKLLYANAPDGMIGNLVNSAILTFILWNVISHTVLITWFFCNFLVTLFRYILVYRYKCTPPESLKIHRWDKWFTFGTACAGIFWGLPGIIMFPVNSIVHQVFLAFVLAGMIAGAMGLYSVRMKVFVVFAIPVSVPIIVRFFAIGGDIHLAMGGMIILFMAIMLTISQRMHKTVINSLKLQFENIDLITHLTDAKEHVENLNEKLKSEIRGHKQAEEALKHRLLVLSQPLGAASNLKLTDIIDIDILQKLQDGFAESYDVASLIVTKEGKPITRPSNFSNFCKIIRATEKGAKKCEMSDANLSRLVADGSSAVAPCSNFEEILDGAVPILIRNKIVATWAIGQKVISELHEDNVQRYAKIIGADTDQLVSAAKKLKLGSKKRFRSAVSFLELMANNISLLGLQNIQQAREISERKRTEEALRQSGEQLRQAQKMEAVGTLAGGIAHDFNNLLQGVMGYTQMLLMDKETGDPDVDKLTQIENSVQRAGELTRQLLTFSRKVESELRPVNINQEIKQVEKLLKRTIPRMIDIELHLEKNIKVVNADPAQVSQALMNFGLNARDAMPDGGKIVVETENVIFDKEYCKTHLGAVPGEYVLLSFSDTGCGMDKETVEHIFEPFYTTKETGKGTGLGLAMVYGIVKSHDGHIMCYSEPGKGTTFKIYFPAIDSAVSSGLSVERKEEMPGGNETILLVDDEEAILDVARNMLERFGYTAITAESGEKAIEIYKAQKERIDLVILDLGMPGIGGHKCLKELLKIDSRIKVIIASGYLKIEKVKETVESGASGFIGKPYQLSGMLKKMREVLGD